MILIDVLRGLFVALTPRRLQIREGGRQVGGGGEGGSATAGFFIQTIRRVESPEAPLGEAEFVCLWVRGQAGR